MKNLKATLLIGAAVSLAALGVVVGAQAKSAPAERPTVTVNAVWDYHPATLAAARAKAEQVVQVTVVSVAAGPDIVTPAKGEPDGVDRIPTQRVTVSVLRAFKGSAKVGDQLTVFQTGGVVSTAVPGDTHPRMVVDGDPFYAAGEQHLLLLVPGPQGTLRIISPEGRYRIDAAGKLSSAVSGPVVAEATAKGLAAFG